MHNYLAEEDRACNIEAKDTLNCIDFNIILIVINEILKRECIINSVYQTHCVYTVIQYYCI